MPHNTTHTDSTAVQYHRPVARDLGTTLLVHPFSDGDVWISSGRPTTAPDTCEAVAR